MDHLLPLGEIAAWPEPEVDQVELEEPVETLLPLPVWGEPDAQAQPEEEDAEEELELELEDQSAQEEAAEEDVVAGAAGVGFPIINISHL